MVVHFFKHIEYTNLSEQNDTLMEINSAWPDSKNGSILFFITAASIGSFVIFLGFGGFLYVNIDMTFIRNC